MASRYRRLAEQVFSDILAFYDETEHDGWRLVDSRSGVTVLNKVSPYARVMKAEVTVFAPCPRVVECLWDINKRKQCDVFLKDGAVVEAIGDNHRVMWLRFFSKFPGFHRDYCVLQSRRDDVRGAGITIVTYRSIVHPKCPQISGHVRATAFGSGFVFKPVGHGGMHTKVVAIFQFDQKVLLEQVLVQSFYRSDTTVAIPVAKVLTDFQLLGQTSVPEPPILGVPEGTPPGCWDPEFRAFLQSVDFSQQEGWESILTDTETDIEVSVREDAMCVQGVFALHEPPASVYKVLMDMLHSNRWDPLISEVTVLKTFANGDQLMRIAFRPVFLGKTRDACVLVRGVKIVGNTFGVTMRSVECDLCHTREGFIRGTVLPSGYFVNPIDNGSIVTLVLCLKISTFCDAHHGRGRIVNRAFAPILAALNITRIVQLRKALSDDNKFDVPAASAEGIRDMRAIVGQWQKLPLDTTSGDLPTLQGIIPSVGSQLEKDARYHNDFIFNEQDKLPSVLEKLTCVLAEQYGENETLYSQLFDKSLHAAKFRHMRDIQREGDGSTRNRLPMTFSPPPPLPLPPPSSTIPPPSSTIPPPSSTIPPSGAFAYVQPQQTVEMILSGTLNTPPPPPPPPPM